jgi:hypothetical protein
VLQARGAYSLVNECDVIHFNTMADFYDEEITFARFIDSYDG